MYRARGRTLQAFCVLNQVREGEAGATWRLCTCPWLSAPGMRNHERSFVFRSRLRPQLPSRDKIARQFGQEKLLALPRLPPAGRVKIGIACAADTQADGRWKNS